MKKAKLLISSILLMASSVAFQSCSSDDNDSWDMYRPTALVTVCPTSDGGFIMQLDNNTTLYPTNMDKSPYGSKEVRALVNYDEDNLEKSDRKDVHVNWIDSIRTKFPEIYIDETSNDKFGNDPVEIVNDWVTVAEDGYLTMRLRALWGNNSKPHSFHLVSGKNPEDPFELELRHNNNGDIGNNLGDILIAFNLNELPRNGSDNVKLKIHWKSFQGDKSHEFDLALRHITIDDIKDILPASMIK
ncbi:NigD-like protein [Lepagella muris]|jgi:hypothetical protein|uniref:Uncharacterized protein n=1 Tax=Lepagella muris TaxID=3032870 RepID=A0AC61RIT5_9BACT|nr:NigD-like protein [Lepagella muris]ROT09359.1 hypothetical protein EEL33_02865 [Muribaculaceae bacterium Isolate-037 (Harlan)]TGY78327.1 hypothetical protein E5331_10615 [Lepagella muris]THG49935.1 hypothetical protein E5984_13990 [Bacteroidales bacterium]TKC57806.1 hypothetical protein E5359_011480 [Bacteroidales bacterium]